MKQAPCSPTRLKGQNREPNASLRRQDEINPAIEHGRGDKKTASFVVLRATNSAFNPATMNSLSASTSKKLENKDKRFVALMRPEDIRESVLTTLDIAVTVDELRRPTSMLVEQLYTAFLQEIFDVDFDDYMVNMQGQPYFSAVSVRWGGGGWRWN